MFTRWYKNILNNMPVLKTTTSGNANSKPCCKLVTVDGASRLWVENGYPTTSDDGYPRVAANNKLVTSIGNVSAYSGAGFIIGKSSKEESEFDYKLEEPITDGTVTYISNVVSYDEYGNIQTTIRLSFTNTTDSAITINEVGWYGYVACSNAPIADTRGSNKVVMFDRTVLEDSVTVDPGETGIIVYNIKSNDYPKIKNGVEIVPFSFASDEKISAVITAAKEGTIDLQNDAGWAVGDVRAVDIGAIGSSEAYTGYVIISSFEEYENCGNIMQLDIISTITTSKMNSSSTNVGGYAASIPYTTTLPALEQALPNWLKNNLKTFSVKVSAGNKSSEIVTIDNNKIALRSEIEVHGTNAYSYAGEGEVIELYKNQAYLAYYNGATSFKWLRSPAYNTSDKFLKYDSGGNFASTASTSSYGMAAFMCI